jgi:hypothetical protein
LRRLTEAAATSALRRLTEPTTATLRWLSEAATTAAAEAATTALRRLAPPTTATLAEAAHH